jgi:gallate decarboxylase subunit D
MKVVEFQAKKGRLRIDARVQPIGNDLLVAVWGGTRPHIGAVGIALPRPSLADPRRWSATSSNFTFAGHKEDLLVKEISETLAAALHKNVVVTAGIHWDDLPPRDLATVQDLVRRLVKTILATKQRKRRAT